jgi:hypothetical protein
MMIGGSIDAMHAQVDPLYLPTGLSCLQDRMIPKICQRPESISTRLPE